jgi:hypothetical protein
VLFFVAGVEAVVLVVVSGAIVQVLDAVVVSAAGVDTAAVSAA